MKKINIFLMILFLGLFFLTPTKVFAFFQEYTAVEWYNHITEFDKGYAYGQILHSAGFGDEEFSVTILKEPSGDIIYDYVIYDGSEDLIYFEPQLHDVILHWIDNDFYDDYYELSGGDEFVPALENTIGLTNYSGYLYWNFEEQYWQIDYYCSPGYLEDEEFRFIFQFTEFTETENYFVLIDFTYPIVVFEGTEIPIEIDLRNLRPSITIESISFFDQQFGVYVTKDENDTVNFFVDSNYTTDKISLTFLEYTFNDSPKTKNITVDMPVIVYSSLLDMYNQIAILEYDKGYNDGYDDGLADGASGGDYQEGYQTGYDEGYQTGYNEGILACDYQEGYQEGYQDGFIAGEKSKIAKNNETFYKNIAIWIPAAISLIALASIISIFGIKRKNE